MALKEQLEAVGLIDRRGFPHRSLVLGDIRLRFASLFW